MASTHAGQPPLGPGPVRKRPRELEDPLNFYLYHPLAARLARLLRPTGISPNAVSIAGMLCIWAAAAAYYALSWPQSAILGLLLHMLWHVVDGADGDLARLTGKSSPTGELIDGLCDYAGHAPLYVVLAIIAQAQVGWWAWPLATLAAFSHGLQANHAESQRRSYLWWAYGVPWLKQARPADQRSLPNGSWVARVFAWPSRLYLWLAKKMAPNMDMVDAAIAEAALDPRRLERVRRLVRQSSRGSLILQKVIGANPRTLILGACMLIEGPLAYFLVQLALLNLVLIFSVRHHDQVGQRLKKKLAAERP